LIRIGFQGFQIVTYLINILNALIILVSFVLICIVLIQRGRGGGLAGAFGGVGGSSAFGTKAGDVFTRVTVGVAIAWILLAMLLVRLTNLNSGASSNPALDFGSGSSLSKELGPSRKTPGGADVGALPPGSPTSGVLPGAGTSGPAGVAAGTGSLGSAAPTVSVPPIPETPAPATKK
jgi:preprotein translocase subunit SecG